MNNPPNLMVLSLALALLSPCVLAIQDQPGAQDTGTESQRDDESGETERRDEQYRRQMELEDARNRTDDVLTQTTYESEANKSKLAKLPRESQQHLKEEMKAIIIEGEQWTPADSGRKYPVEPSEAAKSDANLAQLEAAAWEDMVEGYHQREAAAYAAQQQAGAGGQVAGSQSPNGAPNEAPGGSPQGLGGGQGEQQASAKAGRGGGTYDPNAAADASDAEKTYTAGVSQSALDFLRDRTGGGAGAIVDEKPPGPGGGHPEGSEDGVAGGTAPYGSTEEYAVAGNEMDQGEGEGGQAPAGGLEDDQEGTAEQPEGQDDASLSAEALLAGVGPQGPDGSLPISDLAQLQGMPGDQANSGAPSNSGSPARSADSSGEQSNNPAGSEQDESPAQSIQQQEQIAADSQSAQEQAEESTDPAEGESVADNAQQQSPAEPVVLDLDTPGIIAIRDLDKLEGVEAPLADAPED